MSGAGECFPPFFEPGWMDETPPPIFFKNFHPTLPPLLRAVTCRKRGVSGPEEGVWSHHHYFILPRFFSLKNEHAGKSDNPEEGGCDVVSEISPPVYNGQTRPHPFFPLKNSTLRPSPPPLPRSPVEGIMAGAVGFLASWVFVRYIYAALKVD